MNFVLRKKATALKKAVALGDAVLSFLIFSDNLAKPDRWLKTYSHKTLKLLLIRDILSQRWTVFVVEGNKLLASLIRQEILISELGYKLRRKKLEDVKDCLQFLVSGCIVVLGEVKDACL